MRSEGLSKAKSHPSGPPCKGKAFSDDDTDGEGQQPQWKGVTRAHGRRRASERFHTQTSRAVSTARARQMKPNAARDQTIRLSIQAARQGRRVEAIGRMPSGDQASKLKLQSLETLGVLASSARPATDEDCRTSSTSMASVFATRTTGRLAGMSGVRSRRRDSPSEPASAAPDDGAALRGETSPRESLTPAPIPGARAPYARGSEPRRLGVRDFHHSLSSNLDAGSARHRCPPIPHEEDARFTSRPQPLKLDRCALTLLREGRTQLFAVRRLCTLVGGYACALYPPHRTLSVWAGLEYRLASIGPQRGRRSTRTSPGDYPTIPRQVRSGIPRNLIRLPVLPGCHTEL